MMNISRHSFIFGLSYALDISGKNNLSHSKSTAYISVMIAKEIKLEQEDILSIYYAALLHDIAVSDEFLLGTKYVTDMKKHCVVGGAMLKKLPLPDEIPRYVLYHHEFYDGSGQFGLSGESIPKGAQIICFASAFDDVFGKSTCYDAELFSRISAWLEKTKELFAEEIVGAFHSLIKREYFLLDYFNIETKYTLAKKIVVDDNVFYDGEDIKKFALCFADIIDQRSPFTFNHSTGIAELAEKVAAHLGYGEEIQYKMHIAGLLHDIGKLNVRPDTLHKNGTLTPEERFEINKHSYFTRKILEQIQGFDDILSLAANHHEKLDGTGYPCNLDGNRLGELERVMAICDVYQALTEERPYRESLPREKVWKILDEMVDKNHLDKELVTKFKLMFDS